MARPKNATPSHHVNLRIPGAIYEQLSKYHEEVKGTSRLLRNVTLQEVINDILAEELTRKGFAPQEQA